VAKKLNAVFQVASYVPTCTDKYGLPMPFSNCFNQNFSFLLYAACAWHLFPAIPPYFPPKQNEDRAPAPAAPSEKHGEKLAFEHIAVFLIEFVHTAGAIHDLLFTSVERMALRANFNVEFGFAHGRFSGEFVTARAGNIDFMVVRMNFRFHSFSFKKRV